jgi:diguanylate cyclase (GGDEF)-like protein/PAS domain S-box-containing protein
MSVTFRSDDPSAWCRPLFDANPLALLVCDPENETILEANGAALACLGLARRDVVGARLPALYADAGMAWGPSSQAMGETVRRIVCADNSVRHLSERRSLIADGGDGAGSGDGGDGGRPALLVVLQDVSRHVAAELRLRETQDELYRAQALARIGTWEWDLRTDAHCTASPLGYRVLGMCKDEVPMTSGEVAALIHPDDREMVLRSRDRALRDPGYKHDVEFRMQGRGGAVRWLHAVAEVRRGADGRPEKMFGLLQDVTDRRTAEDDVRRLAYYDSLTGLANRNRFEQVCNEGLARIAADGGRLACVIVDLMRFRDVNYALAHSSGDALLGLVAERLSALVGDAGLVARVDARFPILLGGVDECAARGWAQAVHRALEEPFLVAGIQYEIGARIGIALAPEQGTDYPTLLRKADIALFQACRDGRNLAVYSAAADPHTPDRLALIGDFRAAIEDGQIRLFCQPKVDMLRNEIVGVEALVRWCHPEKGTIGPEVFMPLIESTDLVHLLTRHMLAGAVSWCEEWLAQGVHLPVAVNLSARDVAALTLSEHLGTLMESHGACAGMIGLEMTESSLMRNPEASIAELERLRAMGFRLYIDDFGTGYSSLNYLTRLPVDVIKIDHGFTMKMIDDRRAAAIVKSTVQLAHDLGMQVVAEGVSERRIWDALCAIGCDEAQGYHIAPPMPAADILRWAHGAPFALRSAPPADPPPQWALASGAARH